MAGEQPRPGALVPEAGGFFQPISAALPDDDVIELFEAVSNLSPKAARRATKLMSGVVRTVSR